MGHLKDSKWVGNKEGDYLMSAAVPVEHPKTRDEYIKWLNDSAPVFIGHGKTYDELKAMNDKELTQLYDSVLGIVYFT